MLVPLPDGSQLGWRREAVTDCNLLPPIAAEPAMVAVLPRDVDCKLAGVSVPVAIVLYGAIGRESGLDVVHCADCKGSLASWQQASCNEMP